METGYHASLRLDDDDIDCAQKRSKVRASLALFKNLAQMLQQQQFCDLVFELTGSIKFHTHRLVFALWSPVMMNLLNQSSSRVEKVLVKTNLQGAFKQFVHFLYSGTFEGNVTDIDGVLLLASTFQIPLLRSLCEKQLQQAVSVENVIGLFRTSVRYQLSFLEKQCVEHIQDHLPEVAQQSELKDLNPEQFNTFLASKHVSQLNPEMKLFLIISWLTEHVNDRQHFLVLLLRHIDWSTVAQDFLTEISQTENFFTSHPSSLYLLLQTLHSASISLGPYTDRFEELRSEYNEILNNVVTNSVNIGNGRQEVFQPIQLTLISGLAREKEKTQSEPKKPNIVNRNSSNNKTSKVKLKPDPPRDSGGKAVNKSSSSNSTVGSRKRANNVLGNRNLKEKESAGKLKKNDTSSAKQNGNREVTSTPRAASEGGSMRRKTLRPRKVVSSSSSISIVSPSSSRTVSTRRTTALQKAERDNNEEETETSLSKSAHPETNQQQDDEEETDEEADHNDPLLIKTEEYVGNNDDNDDDYVDPSALKRQKKERSKTVLGKSKMGRPRKGYERNKFSCPQCEYVTRKSYLLDKHIRQVHESKRVIKCPICEFRCNWSKKLYIHMRADHYNNSGPPFVCDIQECTYTNDKMNKLVEHRRSHTGDRPFMCDECKMSFRSKSNLYAHFKCHNDIRNHECPICHQRFKMKITMEQHLVVHDDARPYECGLCGFSTKYQALLKAHTRRHTGDVFPCTFPSCTYSTPKKSTLQAHMRSHLGIRHHVCETCQKAFIEKSHLVRHMRIHTSEKQHKCQQCDYASHRLDKLREHLQKHEREANRNNNKDAEGGNDDAASKDTVPSSEPKKKRRKKKEEMPKKKQTSSKIKDSTTTSSKAGIKLESTSNATAVPGVNSVNTSPANIPQPAQGVAILGNDSSTSNGNNGIGTILPSSDLNVGIGRATNMSTVHEPVNIIVETGTHYEHVSNTHSYDGSNNSDTAAIVHLPAPKLEKDWNEIELLTRMGFTVTAEGHSVNLQPSVPTATSHVIRTVEASNRGEELNTGIINNNASIGNSGGGNGLTEFTDMFRGFEALPPSSSSIAVAAPPDSRDSDHDLHHRHHHHALHSSISVIPSDGGGRIGDGGGSNIYPGPPHPPSRTIVLASYPHQEDLETATSSQHLRGTKNSNSDPHPIIMIPNMSSSIISSPPQTYLHHHHQSPQQQHHHHHQQHHLHPQHHQHHPPHQNQHQPQGDDDQRRYHHQRQHPSPSSSSSSLSQHHQQILHQQQQGNPSGQSSSNYSHFTGYHY